MTTDNVVLLKQVLIDRIWLALFALATFAVPLSVSRSWYTGWKTVYTVNLVVWALGGLTTLLRRRLHRFIKLYILVSCLALVGVAGLFNFGLLGSGVWYLVMGTIIVGVIHSTRAGLMMAGMTLTLLIIFTYGHTTGFFRVRLDANAYIQTVSPWVLLIVACTLLPSIVLIAIGFFQRTILTQLLTLKEQRDLLAKREEQLQQQTKVLEQTRDAALEASRAKSEFLATMSHEIRTPLNGVIGMAGLLRETPLSAAQSEKLSTIQSSGQALLALINEILDFSKIEAGKLSVKPSIFVVRSWLVHVLKPFHIQAEQKGLELRVVVDENVPESLLADHTRLRQILVNLVGNALKFTTHGHIAVRFFYETPHHLILAVQDTGLGIPEEAQAKLFTPFEQVASVDTREHGGTGLGLAISARLTRLMGGSIEVESNTGQGTRFTARIIAPPTEDIVDVSHTAALTSPAHNTSPRFAEELPLSILVVEDHPVNLDVTVGSLGLLGYTPDTAIHGKEAIQRNRDHDYDLILMDLHMPEMSGIEATHHILKQKPKTVIVALTASVLPHEQSACYAAGMLDFLPKPFSINELQAMLQRVFHHTTSSDQFTSTEPDPLAKLCLLCEGDPAQFAALIQKHIESAEKLVTSIYANIQSKDTTSLCRNAHSLKSSAALFGGSALSELAANVEFAASQQDLVQASHSVDALQQAFDMHKATLYAYEYTDTEKQHDTSL